MQFIPFATGGSAYYAAETSATRVQIASSGVVDRSWTI